MADMKPIGIDQTTGQQREVADNDNLADNIGDTIEIAVTQVGDYSGNLRNKVTALFPWDAPEKLDDPASLPVIGFGIAWSPNGEFLSVADVASVPGVFIYQRTGTNLVRLDDPASLLPNVTSSTAWSADGEFLAFGVTNTTPYVAIYQRSGSTFTLVSDGFTNPSVGAGSSVNTVAFSPTGEFFAMGWNSFTPFFRIYRRDGTTFTSLSDPSSLPLVHVNNVSWSPDGAFLAVSSSSTFYIYERTDLDAFELVLPTFTPGGGADASRWSPNGEFVSVAHSSSPFVTTYQRSGSTFTKISDPTTLPTGLAYACDWSPNSKRLAVGNSGATSLTIYERDGTILTKIADPASLPTNEPRDLMWSSDGQFLATTGGSSSPSIEIYQTSSNMPTSGIVKIVGDIKAGG